MMHLWSNNLPDAGGNNPTSSSSNETHELNINVDGRAKNGSSNNGNNYFTRSPQNFDSSAKFELAGGGAGLPRPSDPSSMPQYTVLRDGGPATSAAAANTLNGGFGAYQTVMSTGDDGAGAGGGGGGSSAW